MIQSLPFSSCFSASNTSVQTIGIKNRRITPLPQPGPHLDHEKIIYNGNPGETKQPIELIVIPFLNGLEDVSYIFKCFTMKISLTKDGDKIDKKRTRYNAVIKAEKKSSINCINSIFN